MKIGHIITYKNLNEGETYVAVDANNSKPWRDISFKGTWSSPERVQIKYYQYNLYDSNGELIAQSEEIYDSELTWFFRGFQTSDYENVPVKYTIELIVTDEYDAQFLVANSFLIFYQTEEGVIPLNVTLDCNEQALRLEVQTPSYVETTDKDGKPTVDNDDLDVMEDFLSIPNGKVLNYTTVDNAQKDPIIISASFTYLTQFRITGNFLDIIPAGGSQTITEVAHKISDGVFDYFTLKLYDFNSFYYNEDAGIIQINNERFKMKWFKNGSDAPLACFENGTKDYYDISEEDQFQQWAEPSKFLYALQPQSNYTFIITFPLRPSTGVDYVLTQDINYNQQIYYSGIYNWDGRKWVPNTTAEYFFIENINQVSDSDYDSLGVPENARATDDSGNLLWEEEGNVWLDNGEYTSRINKEVLDSRWFLCYLTVNNTSDTEVVRCTMEINDHRV